MGIKCQTYEVNSGTFLFDFELVPTPDDHRSLADRLKEIDNEEKRPRLPRRLVMAPQRKKQSS